MATHSTKRYCADPEALAAMKRDGMGWGHDLDCGCYRDATHTTRRSGLTRVINAFKLRF